MHFYVRIMLALAFVLCAASGASSQFWDMSFSVPGAHVPLVKLPPLDSYVEIRACGNYFELLPKGVVGNEVEVVTFVMERTCGRKICRSGAFLPRDHVTAVVGNVSTPFFCVLERRGDDGLPRIEVTLPPGEFKLATCLH